MPQLDFRKPRLFVLTSLASGETATLERSQSNYLGNVLRLSAGDEILVFNGRDGEWRASIEGRKRPDCLTILNRTRPQDRLPDLNYVFAPLKHARLDYMVQKAVEMGAASLQPVLTRFTQVNRVNRERMRANVIEAAEQCGILSIAQVAEPIALDRYLAQRMAQRLLVFCDEAADAESPVRALQGGQVSGGIDVLIGPEGGFAEEERTLLLRQPRTLRLSWDHGYCAPIRLQWPPWRWYRLCWATGPVPPSRNRGSPALSTLRHLADPSRNRAPVMLRAAPASQKGPTGTLFRRFGPQMTSTAAPRATGSAAWADALLLSFAQAGYLRAEPAILQPAEPFLDLSGEDIRKSLYLTTDAGGEELCLRPDLTIPVARDYLASPRAGQPSGFSYLGPVFRYRGGRPSEFLQAGIESFGRQDRAAADAEMLALALQATQAFGLTEVEIRTGDVALFNALIDALELYPVWRRRLIKDFNRKISLEQDIERLTHATASTRNEYEGVLAALAGSDRKAALALVTDLMSIAGATNVGGRSVSEIADRFLEQSTLKGGALPRDALGLIKRFLAIAGDPGEAIVQLRALARDTKLDINAAIDQFESRVGFMAARGIDTARMRFATSFGRGLDYYTGFEFELHSKDNGVEPLVAGGRYDSLMTQLGAGAPIPAVGFSVWVEALTQTGSKSGSAS